MSAPVSPEVSETGTEMPYAKKRGLREFGGGAVADVRKRQVVARAHLGEPAERARELPRVRSLRIQRVGRDGRGCDELHAMIVQDVDQPGEAPRLVRHVRAQQRNIGQEDDGEA